MFYRHHRSSSVSTLIYTHCLGSSSVSPTDASVLFSHASATFRHTSVHLGVYFHHYTTSPRTCHLQLRCLGHCDYDYNYRNTVSISAVSEAGYRQGSSKVQERADIDIWCQTENICTKFQATVMMMMDLDASRMKSETKVVFLNGNGGADTVLSSPKRLIGTKRRLS
jgi:hypothetical protein